MEWFQTWKQKHGVSNFFFQSAKALIRKLGSKYPINKQLRKNIRKWKQKQPKNTKRKAHLTTQLSTPLPSLTTLKITLATQGTTLMMRTTCPIKGWMTLNSRTTSGIRETGTQKEKQDRYHEKTGWGYYYISNTLHDHNTEQKTAS